VTILRLEDSALVVLGAIFAVVEVLHHLVELLGHEPLGGLCERLADAGVDLSQLLIPILIIAGLALLFPSITEVDVNATGRKRRSAEGDASPLANMVERVQDMYSAILQSEECIERVACEVGGLASDAGISKSLTKAAEGFVPKKFNKMMKNFNHGKDCSKNNKCGVF
jgi:hypothetical protein